MSTVPLRLTATRAWSALCIVLVWSGAIALVWTLLAGLLVEDRGAYVERARDWSVQGVRP